MILLVAAVLSTLGFGVWGLGTMFQYHGLAAVGGVIVVAVGAAGMADGGFSYETGTVERETGPNTTERVDQYDRVELPGNFSFGMVVMLVGALAAFQSLVALGEEGSDA